MTTPIITDAMIEKAARAIYETEYCAESYPWAKRSGSEKWSYHQMAKGVLSAIATDIARQARAEGMREAAKDLARFIDDNPGQPSAWISGVIDASISIDARAHAIEKGEG